MLRQTGGFGGGGGRPPVNIEVNFLAGDNNAFKQAREDVKALKADLDSIARHSFFNGGGGGGGFAPGGGGGVPTAPGTVPTIVPTAPRPGTPGGSGGGPGAIGPRSTGRYIDSRSDDQIKRDHAAYLAWLAASQTRFSDDARRRAADDAEFMARQASKIHEAYKGAAIGAASALDPFSGGGSGRSIDYLQANINRRRQGLPDLPDPTIAAAAANVGAGAAGAYGSGFLGTGIAAGVAIPAGALAALAGVAAVNTPQGTERIGSFGGWLEGVTREEGFAQQFAKSFGRLTGANLGGDGGWRNPVQWYRDTALGPWVEQAQTGERVNRMLASQSAGNMGYQLGQLSELSSAGFGMDALSASRAQNELRISQLSDQFSNRASLSPDQQFQAGEALKGALQEQLQLKQQELSIQQSILDTRIRERDAVEQMVSSQFGSLAGRSRGELRRLDRDFQSIEGGSNDYRAANRLAAAGINTPEVSQIRENYVREAAPGIASYLQGMRDTVRASVDRQTELVATLTTQIGIASDGQIKSMTGLAEAILKRFEEIDAAQKTIIDQIVTQKKNDGVKNSQQSRVPGAGVRGPGVGG